MHACAACARAASVDTQDDAGITVAFIVLVVVSDAAAAAAAAAAVPKRIFVHRSSSSRIEMPLKVMVFHLRR